MQKPDRLSGSTVLGACLALLLALAPLGSVADTLSGQDLVEALRSGGHTIYFRHAETDWSGDDSVSGDGDWKSCDPAEMRQLSDGGRETAARIGSAIRGLGIPIGEIVSSEYCRAAETARRMDLGPVRTTRDVMNLRSAAYVGGREAATRRLQTLLSSPPQAGTNRIVSGHGNVIRAATEVYPSEAGAAIFKPVAADDFTLVARLTPDAWQALAAEFGSKAAAPARSNPVQTDSVGRE